MELASGSFVCLFVFIAIIHHHLCLLPQRPGSFLTIRFFVGMSLSAAIEALNAV